MKARRTLLVEDEPPARRLLRRLLGEHEHIVVSGEAGTVAEAVRAIAAEPPDLIFLDVHLPDGTGFEVFDRVAVRAPVIFVTAHDEFALRAFEVSALDYLLKPVDPARLGRALARLDSVASRPEARPPLRPTDTICVRARQGYRFVRIADIVFFEASDKYTEAHLADGSSELCDVTMNDWAARLPAAEFVRIHRGYIVRVAALERLEAAGDSGWVVRLRGSAAAIPVGRKYVAALRDRFEI